MNLNFVITSYFIDLEVILNDFVALWVATSSQLFPWAHQGIFRPYVSSIIDLDSFWSRLVVNNPKILTDTLSFTCHVVRPNLCYFTRSFFNTHTQVILLDHLYSNCIFAAYSGLSTDIFLELKSGLNLSDVSHWAELGVLIDFQ